MGSKIIKISNMNTKRKIGAKLGHPCKGILYPVSHEMKIKKGYCHNLMGSYLRHNEEGNGGQQCIRNGMERPTYICQGQ